MSNCILVVINLYKMKMTDPGTQKSKVPSMRNIMPDQGWSDLMEQTRFGML